MEEWQNCALTLHDSLDAGLHFFRIETGNVGKHLVVVVVLHGTLGVEGLKHIEVGEIHQVLSLCKLLELSVGPDAFCIAVASDVPKVDLRFPNVSSDWG